MRDTWLWRCLGAGERPPELAAELRALAGESAVARAPFVGAARALLGDADAEVRAAAVAVLAGMRGIVGLRALVGALDDDDAAVRAAAVASLRVTCKDVPLRWAHVAFHRRADVRRASLVDPPPQVAHFATWLRADPACRDAIAAPTWPAGGPELAVDLFARGVVSASEAAARVVASASADVRSMLLRSRRRNEVEVGRFLAAAHRGPSVPVLPGADVLDLVCAMIEGAGAHQDALVAVVGDAVLVDRPPLLRARMLASMLGHGLARLPATAVRLAAACNPVVLAVTGVPLELRRVAVRGLVDHRDRLVAVPEPLVAELLASKIVHTPAGSPDVAAAAAIASLLPHRRVRALVDVFGEDELVHALARDDAGWRAIATLPPEIARHWLLERVRAYDPAAFARLSARALVAWHTTPRADFDTLVAALDEPTAAAAARALVRLDPPPEEGGVAETVLALLGKMAVPDHDAFVADALADDPAPPVAIEIIRTLVRLWLPAELGAAVTRLPTPHCRTLVGLAADALPLGSDHLLALVAALAGRDDPVVAAFVARVTRDTTARPSAPRRPADTVHNLSAAQVELVAACHENDLEAALAPALELPCRGLADALARRPAPSRPHLAACVALVAAIDGTEPVARELARFGSDAPDFLDALRAAVATLWRGASVVPPLLDAWLHEWEEHALAFGTFLDAEEGGVAGALAAAAALPCAWAARRMWDAAATLLRMRLFREPMRADPRLTADLVDLAVEQLSGALGPAAAQILSCAVKGGRFDERLAELRTRVIERAHALDRDTRFELSGWLRLEVAEPRALTEVATETSPRQRFDDALARAETREHARLADALAVALALGGGEWFELRDWDRLAKLMEERALALVLVRSPQTVAHRRAVEVLVGMGALDGEAMAALRESLEEGTARPFHVRLTIAMHFLAAGDPVGAPILLTDSFGAAADAPTPLGGVPASERPRWVEAIVDAALVGGRGFCAETRVIGLLQGLSDWVRAPVHERLLLDGVDTDARARLVAALPKGLERAFKLQDVADVFAWGVRRGRELTGRVISVHMTSKREDYGHTPLDRPAIFVTPLPILRGDRNGRDVVEALVLHELGHQVYHRGKAALRVWKQARKEGLFGLLNLVADEHLERNLRAVDESFGDRLKRLAAYAFQHASREIEVERLLAMLQGAAAEVLPAIGLGVAYSDDSVRIDSGALLAELERRGDSFARFVRALRMGLGDRHDDPLVRSALDLFKGGFRRRDMAGLYEVTKRLSELFGGLTDLSRCFGGHESLEWDERDEAIHGSDIDDGEVQREVERILGPPPPTRNTSGRPGRLQINVGAQQRYDPITSVRKLPPDEAKHRAAAREVKRHADRLRELLAFLGLAYEPHRARLRGRSFDRTRTKALVVRRDPRILLAREPDIRSDLFVGVAIDCSGSMSGKHMDMARRFGVLLAEATRGMRGVDTRFFGFTDRLIYDAGDARRCAVTSLDAGGGNNDAAALDHVAQEASRSHRRAKLLVMISDGLPTECSVPALKAVVDQLTRRHGMCCAQVAVAHLEEVCFPHYVEVEETELDAAVRRFGAIAAKLVGRALGR